MYKVLRIGSERDSYYNKAPFLILRLVECGVGELREPAV